MKILYGVQATGNGHIARARTMLPELVAAGIETDFLFSGASSTNLFDMECFGTARFLEGLSFVAHNGKINQFATARNLHPLRFINDVRQLNLRDYDMVLSDFEPISAWAAKWQKLPSVGISNQFSLLHQSGGLQLPGTMRLFLQHFAPCDCALGLSWYRLHDTVLPPLSAPLAVEPSHNGGFILVYLPVENLKHTLHWLTRFPEWIFHVYHHTDTPQEIDNIRLFPLSRSAFAKDLACCDGVLCNSGFGVCTEAIQAGKKILTQPLSGQFEQQANATILQQHGRAVVMHHYNDAQMRDWLACNHDFAPVNFPNVARAVAQWLREGRIGSAQELSEKLWQEN